MFIICASANESDVEITGQIIETQVNEEVTENQVIEETEVSTVKVTSLTYIAGCDLKLKLNKDGVMTTSGEGSASYFTYNYIDLVLCDGCQFIISYSDGSEKVFLRADGVFITENGEVLDESLLTITDNQADKHWVKPGSYHITITYDGYSIQLPISVESDNIPAEPKLKSLKLTKSGITISWKSAKNAAGYNVYRRLKGNDKWSCIGTTKKERYTDKNVKNNKTYEYSVKAFNDEGIKGRYSEAKAITFVSAPKIKSLINTEDGVVVRWNKIAGAAQYRIYRRGAGAKKWTYLGTTDKNSFTDKKASAGKYWKYTVRAYNGNFSDYYTSGPCVKRLKNPSNLKTGEYNKCVSFTWKETAGATKYVVYKKQLMENKWKRVCTTKNNFYADKSVSSGNTYVYTVRAVCGNYKSSYNTSGISRKYTANNLQYYVNTVTNGEYAWPVPYSDVLVSSRYKMRTLNGRTRMHNGIDVVREYNTHGSKVVAVKDGTVITASNGYNGGYGNYVVIDHGNGVETTYAHLSSVNCTRGEKVKQGELIGKIGNTGYSFGAHLHFGIKVNGEWRDPFLYLTQTEGWVRCTDV